MATLFGAADIFSSDGQHFPTTGRGEVIPDTLLAHLAPLGWQHINLTGNYLWDAVRTLGPVGFRSLRTVPDKPCAIAA